jgi:hypothetical protein
VPTVARCCSCHHLQAMAKQQFIIHRVVPLATSVSFAPSIVPTPVFLALSVGLTHQTNEHLPSVMLHQPLLIFAEGFSPFGLERNCCRCPQIQISIIHFLHCGLEALEALMKTNLVGCSWFMHLVYCLFMLSIMGCNLFGVSGRLILSGLLVIGRLRCHE